MVDISVLARKPAALPIGFIKNELRFSIVLLPFFNILHLAVLCRRVVAVVMMLVLISVTSWRVTAWVLVTRRVSVRVTVDCTVVVRLGTLP